VVAMGDWKNGLDGGKYGVLLGRLYESNTLIKKQNINYYSENIVFSSVGSVDESG
jgi:hypothetical protein